MKTEIPEYTTFEEIGDLLTLQTSDGVTVFSERQLGYREALPVPLDAPVEAVPDCQLQGQRKVDFVGSEPTSSSHHQSVGEMITSAMYTFSALEFRKGQQNYVLPRTTASSSNVGFAKEPIPEADLRQRKGFSMLLSKMEKSLPQAMNADVLVEIAQTKLPMCQYAGRWTRAGAKRIRQLLKYHEGNGDALPFVLQSAKSHCDAQIASKETVKEAEHDDCVPDWAVPDGEAEPGYI